MSGCCIQVFMGDIDYLQCVPHGWVLDLPNMSNCPGNLDWINVLADQHRREASGLTPTDLPTRLRATADDPYSDLSYHDYRVAADEIEKWRALAMDWMTIATNLLDVDGDNRAWASGEGWDALQKRTQAVIGINHS